MTTALSRDQIVFELIQLGFTEDMVSSFEDKTFDPTSSDQELAALLLQEDAQDDEEDTVQTANQIAGGISSEKTEEVVEDVKVSKKSKGKAKKEVVETVEAEEVTAEEVSALKADYVLIGNVKANGVYHKKGTPIPNDSHLFEFFNSNGFLVKK